VEEGRPNTTFASATSDAFFERPENRVRAQGSQRTLIDGDHSLAKALRDFENLEALAAHNSVIAIHDVVPMTWMARTATSKAETTFHTGDVAPDENAYRGQIGGQRVADREKGLFQRSGEATIYQLYAAPRESAFGTKRTFHG